MRSSVGWDVLKMKATFMFRLKAFLYDDILIMLYAVALFVVSTFLIPSLQNLFQGSVVVAQLTGFFVITLPVSLYFVICDSRLVGQTFGKKKVGIQVVNQEGESLSVFHSSMRTILKFTPWEMSHFLVYRLVHLGSEGVPLHLNIIGGVIYALIFTYILTAIFTRRKQALYDLICRTQVIVVKEIHENEQGNENTKTNPSTSSF